MLKCVLLPKHYNLVLKSTMTSVLGPVRPLFFLVRATLYLSAKEAHKVVLFQFVDILLLRISHETCHRGLVQRKFFLLFLPRKKYPHGLMLQTSYNEPNVSLLTVFTCVLT